MTAQSSPGNLPSTEVQQPEAQKPLLPVAAPPTGHSPGSTEGMSMVKFTEMEKAVLMREPNAETEVEIRPDGIVYMPAVVVRNRLNEAVGPGRWALRQERDPAYDPTTEECIFDGSIWIDGKFAARAIGGCRWKPGNRKMTKTDAIEGARSDCIKRCAKGLGIASELWAPAWVRQFIADYAIPYQGKDYNGKPKVLWRKDGVSLGGDALASASALAGEFPLGFSPDTAAPDGEYSGRPLRDVPDDYLATMAQQSKTVEWRLSAKAEIVRRTRVAAEQVAEEVEPAAEDGGVDAILQDGGEAES